MEKIRINADKPYDILIEKGLLKQTGALIKEVISVCKVCIVTDSNVGPLYAEELLISLADAGYETNVFQFTAGEQNKSVETLSNLVEYMARKEMTRKDIVIALGGGVVGDLAGFAASIYMRGIRYIQMPTTLLSSLDSSVGGKTAADLAAGKNYIGTFWQPSMVICDYSLLDTLPRERYLDGIAEAVKMGAIRDVELFKYLGSIAPEPAQIIKKGVEIKADIVEQDERDTGIRAILNFGHTIGHAIEKCSGFTITHGYAVAIGMVVISKAAFAKGYCKDNLAVPIENLLKHYGLPTSCEYNAKELAEAMLADKKRDGEVIKVVLLDSIGEARLQDLRISELRDFLAAGL